MERQDRMIPGRYTKKPVTIEAMQLPQEMGDSITTYAETCIAIAEWCGGTSYMMVNDDEDAYYGAPVTGPYVLIATLEGDMCARPGDFIIKGIKGEFYPCKPDIFAETYTLED